MNFVNMSRETVRGIISLSAVGPHTTKDNVQMVQVCVYVLSWFCDLYVQMVQW